MKTITKLLPSPQNLFIPTRIPSLTPLYPPPPLPPFSHIPTPPPPLFSHTSRTSHSINQNISPTGLRSPASNPPRLAIVKKQKPLPDARCESNGGEGHAICVFRKTFALCFFLGWEGMGGGGGSEPTPPPGMGVMVFVLFNQKKGDENPKIQKKGAKEVKNEKKSKEREPAYSEPQPPDPPPTQNPPAGPFPKKKEEKKTQSTNLFVEPPAKKTQTQKMAPGRKHLPPGSKRVFSVGGGGGFIIDGVEFGDPKAIAIGILKTETGLTAPLCA